MSNLLTISIPTFNRPDLLKTLIADLLDSNLGTLVEINVHDNSNRDIQHLNKLSCSGVNYFPNLSNLGYEGNIRACIKKATGRYLFILSDDDGYNFRHIGDILKLLSENNFDVLALTCSLSTDASIRFNTLLDSPKCTHMKLGDILNTTSVVTPFNLLPSVIVATSLMKRGELLFPKVNNDYMHSMIFLMGAGHDTKVIFDNSRFLITYNVPELIQFGLYNLLISKEEVTEILEEKFNVRRGLGLESLEISKWCFMSGIGTSKIQFSLTQILYFSYKSLLVLRFLPLVFFWLGLLPKSFKSKLYKLYLQLKSARAINTDVV